MPKSEYVVLVALAVLLLGACSTETVPTEPPAATDTHAAPTKAQPTNAPTEAPTEPATKSPTELPRPTATEIAEETATPAEATATQKLEPQEPTAAVDDQAAAPTSEPEEDVFSFLEVGPDEWVRGPADAAVTIIEYVDFQ
jgi:hypothetical protein